jgi:caffeoyl-CoA O-methyltransferase
MQDFLASIYDYCEENSSELDILLQKVERATHLQTVSPRMLSGFLQGKFLRLLSQIKAPQNILEIGTFTGYATHCLAEGLTETGKIITLEIDPEVVEIARHYFQKSPYKDKIISMLGDAKELITQIDLNFDLVFIDADKMANDYYFENILSKCNINALILVDNVLWSGKILDEYKDQKTKSLHVFNQKIKNDPRVENFILPLRDGLNIIRKK